ncbi:site-specific integrase [Reichenbachiella carrageenanivorans]|uniref:Site-specific integrase n=1 Tax=Reichenbachiella carrageenanivorans TaxID=2979869 RepID=A0ABY6DAM3_9BACT|nr:site-specific integrase [Reichenbachiella carrageenanivorans]UXX80900.1 site-specific integrase [Reichenbachiella carrageenanivorans]
MIEYSLVYNRKKIIGKDGKALIQIRAYKGGKYKYLSSEIKIEPKQWNKEKRKINNNHAQYISLNRILEKRIGEFEDYEISLTERDRECTLDMLEQFHLNGKSKMTFIEFVDYELNHSTLRSGTIRQQRVFYNKIKEFNPNLVFSQIDYDLCCKFERFLIDQGITNRNTIAKEFKNFKKFVNLAIAKEHIDMRKNPFLKFKVKSVPSKKIFLQEDEIRRIENLDLKSDPELDKARDIYMFGVYTGLRFSDIASLRKKDIVKLEDGSWNLEIRMQKTENLLNLPLHKLFKGMPKKLLQKYDRLTPNSEYFFNSYSNEHENRLLKLIAKLAKIDKRLAFHSSRHSFGTTLLNRGVSLEVVQGLMGHKKLQQTQEYAKLLNLSVHRELDKIW